MRRIIFLFMLAMGVIYGQAEWTSQQSSYPTYNKYTQVEQDNSVATYLFRVGTSPSDTGWTPRLASYSTYEKYTLMQKGDTVAVMYYLMNPESGDTLGFAWVADSAFYADTSLFARATRYIVDQNGDTVAQGLNNFLAATEIFVPRINTDTLGRIGSTVTVLDNVNIVGQGSNNARLTYTAGTQSYSTGVNNAFGDFFQIGLGANFSAPFFTYDWSAGYLGFKTDVPSSPFHFYLNDANVGSNAGMTIEQVGTGDPKLSFLTTQNWGIGIDKTDDYFKISRTASFGTTDAIVIDNSNRVAIGGQTPTFKLDVTGDIRATTNITSDSANFRSASIQDLYGGGPLTVHDTMNVPVVNADRVINTYALHAIAGCQDSSIVIDLTQDQWAMVTNAKGTMLQGRSVYGFIPSNDTLIVTEYGYYVGTYVIGFTIALNNNVQFRGFNVTQNRATGYTSIVSGRGAGVYQPVTLLFDERANPGDRLIVQVMNVSNNNDITIIGVSSRTLRISY